MYIDKFLLGVICTLSVEVLLMISLAVVKGFFKKRDEDPNEDQKGK